jgi:hypothetical protein
MKGQVEVTDEIKESVLGMIKELVIDIHDSPQL